MKATVTMAYTDRETGAVHLAGEIVELSDARAEELEQGGYVKAEKAAPKPRARKAAPKSGKAE
jgi:hypothetical protein